MKHVGFLFAGMFAGSVLIACGGKVVFVDGSGGAGPSASHASGTGGFAATAVGPGGPTTTSGPTTVGPVGPTTTTGPSTVTSSGSGGGIAGECSSLCGLPQIQMCGGGANCVQNCISSYEMQGICQPQYKVLLDCYLQNENAIQNCNPPPACEPALQAFMQCSGMMGGQTAGVSSAVASGATGGGCTQSCGVGNATCQCDQTCNGIDLQVKCVQGVAGVHCKCFENGVQVGKCQNGDVLSCDVMSSCCGPIFAQP
jgi:hypothetical protein